jgi:hypothetical protein
VVVYNYAAHGAGSDPADIYVTRSTNNGSTWSAPVKLNTDNSGKAQWMPSLLISEGGVALATWYDRRNTTDGLNYERFGRISTDSGATWGPEMPISDVLIPQPVQPDPFVQACYAGDYNYITANGDTGYDAWTDGRVAISGSPQQDVFFDKIPLGGNRPPVCSGVRPDRTRLWPPNHSLQVVTLSGATDPDGDPLRLEVTSVTQDEPLNGAGDGDSSPDAKRATAPNQVFLRAERSGNGDGRVYRVSFSVSDGKGGTCTGSVTVGVPRNQAPGGNPVDSGQTFNSFR